MKINGSNKPVNKPAKTLALTFGIINCGIYILLTAVFFISPKATNYLMEYIDGIVTVTYGTFLISLVTACAFKVTTRENRPHFTAAYACLLIINVMTSLIYAGLSNFGTGQLFG